MPPENGADTLPVKSLGRAFGIVEHLKGADGAGVSEIAAALDTSKSTVHDHLRSLRTLGYVVQEDGEYRLGLRFLDLGDAARSHYDLYEVAKPEVDGLVDTTGERAQVMVVEDGRGVYIYQAAGDRAIKTDSHVGTTVHLHSTAVGKAYLAFQPEDRRAALLDGDLASVTQHTVTDVDDLRDELETIRERGYATNLEERITGMRAIGAPILDQDGHSVAALSISGPTTRLHGEFFTEELPERVQQVARVLSIKTRYS